MASEEDKKFVLSLGDNISYQQWRAYDFKIKEILRMMYLNDQISIKEIKDKGDPAMVLDKNLVKHNRKHRELGYFHYKQIVIKLEAIWSITLEEKSKKEYNPTSWFEKEIEIVINLSGKEIVLEKLNIYNLFSFWCVYYYLLQEWTMYLKQQTKNRARE